MSQSHSCSMIDSWVRDSAAELSAEEMKRFEEHLESCSACQARLDGNQELIDPLLCLARQVGDPTLVPADPTLEQLLSQLHETPSAVRGEIDESTDLYFLSPTDRPDLLGTIGNYEVQEVIGQGGMGLVLKAFDPSLHRAVAIKVMAAAVAGSANARRRFTREAQSAASVCHEHVITVHGVSETNGLPFMVMQYIGGESLQARIDRIGPLELEDIVRIAMQTAQGLAAAHAQGLIHRDIKPANLLLENGLARVKITDFGLARMTDDVGLTQCGVVAGTPEYMAPEQARGEPVDHRSDLFSLGSVLYTMCAGVPPFRGANTVAVLRKVSDEEPTPLRSLAPNVPGWLEQFIARLMAKAPAKRLQSSAHAALLLESYLAHLRQPASAPMPELPTAYGSSGTGERPNELFGVQDLPRRFWVLALTFMILLGVGGGLIGWRCVAPGIDFDPGQGQVDGSLVPGYQRSYPWLMAAGIVGLLVLAVPLAAGLIVIVRPRNLPSFNDESPDQPIFARLSPRSRKLALAFLLGIPLVASIAMACLAGPHESAGNPTQEVPSLLDDSDNHTGWIGAAVAIVAITGMVLFSILFAVRHGWRSTGQAPHHLIDSTPLMVSFPCALCGKRIRVKADWSGKKGKCLHCGKEAIVPPFEDS